jgi:glycosyltransferase involved in cell wall biosynthesis
MSAPNPRVTVVIPNYNHAPLLRLALRSVAEQSFSDWEAIVIDNHSNDGSESEVHALADERIRIAKVHNHGVIGRSRNIGIAEARGEWVAFLDADDLWDREKLKRCLELSRDAEFIYHPLRTHRVTNGHPETVGCLKQHDISAEPARWLLEHGPMPLTSGVMARTDILRRHGGFDEATELIAGEDYDMWLRLAQGGARFAFISTPLGSYLVSGTHQSSAKRALTFVPALQRKHLKTLEASKSPDWMLDFLLGSAVRARRPAIAFRVLASLIAARQHGRALRLYAGAARRALRASGQ